MVKQGECCFSKHQQPLYHFFHCTALRTPWVLPRVILSRDRITKTHPGNHLCTHTAAATPITSSSWYTKTHLDKGNRSQSPAQFNKTLPPFLYHVKLYQKQFLTFWGVFKETKLILVNFNPVTARLHFYVNKIFWRLLAIFILPPHPNISERTN